MQTITTEDRDLVYTTQVNSSFRLRWLLTRRWLAKYYSPPSSRRKIKMAYRFASVSEEEILSMNMYFSENHRTFEVTSFSFSWSPDLPYHVTLRARVCITWRANFFVRPFVGILSQIKLLFGPLVIPLVWYILKQLSTSVSVKVVAIYLAASRLCK